MHFVEKKKKKDRYISPLHALLLFVFVLFFPLGWTCLFLCISQRQSQPIFTVMRLAKGFLLPQIESKRRHPPLAERQNRMRRQPPGTGTSRSRHGSPSCLGLSRTWRCRTCISPLIPGVAVDVLSTFFISHHIASTANRVSSVFIYIQLIQPVAAPVHVVTAAVLKSGLSLLTRR